MPETSLRISVIIAAFNARETIHAVLDSIRLSCLQPLEVIVVDDCSADETSAVARHYGCTVLSTERRSGPAHARNLGAAIAQGEILVFLDADVRLHRDALLRLVAHLCDPEVGAAFGAYDDQPPDAGVCSRYRNLLHCHTHRVSRADATTFWAGFGAIRCDLFREFGGFDESYSNASIEDIELGMRLRSAGVRIVLDPEAQSQHLKRWTFARMSRTDIFHRGIPWIRLILKRRRMPNDLNLRWSQRASVAASWIAVAGACMGHALIVETALAVVVACNWRFLSFLKRRAGWMFVIRTFPIHFVFCVYCGLSAVAGMALHLAGAISESFLPSQQPRIRAISKPGSRHAGENVIPLHQEKLAASK